MVDHDVAIGDPADGAVAKVELEHLLDVGQSILGPGIVLDKILGKGDFHHRFVLLSRRAPMPSHTSWIFCFSCALNIGSIDLRSE